MNEISPGRKIGGNPARLRWAAVLAAALAVALLLPAGGFAMGKSRSSAPSPAGPESPDQVYPPSTLVALDNPQQAAIIRHEVEVRLEPATGGCEGSDRITIVHAPGVAMEEPFSFLLWRDLTVVDAHLDPSETSQPRPGGRTDVAPRGFTIEPRERMNPRSFWRRPPYDQLDGYEKARQYDLRPDPDYGVWPETLRLVITWSGSLVDSLRPPAAAYARSFEETAGLIESRGAYLSGASFWVPSRPGDVFSFRLRAEVPDGWRAVSQGAMGPGGTWDCPHPMEEIYLVAGPWTLHEREHRGVRVQSFTYANTEAEIYERYLDGTGRYLDLYDELIGPYPFAKFALVENFWQTGFGMPSFTLLGDRVIRLPFILDTSYGHEILHNWWGNGVFVDYDKGNWCEGLTTYQADYLYREREGPAAARDYRRNALAGYLDYVSEEEDEPLVLFTGRHDAATQAIGYSKSMMVIHQLRRTSGDARFREALRLFYQRHLWRRATWDDLLAAFRDVAGIDPRRFREEWIERPGAPAIGVRDVTMAPEAGRWRVRATLVQGAAAAEPPVDESRLYEPGGPGEKPAAASSAGRYSLLVPVRLEWADRDSTWQVPLETLSTTWSVVVDGAPRRLLVDPDFEVLRRIDRAEIPATLSRTLGADTVTVVIGAGLDPAVEGACRTLAASWAKGQTLTIVEERAQPKGWTPKGSAWYLGLGPGAKARITGLREVRMPGGPRASTDVSLGSAGVAGPDPWRIADGSFTPEHSFVLTGADPHQAGASWTVIAPSGASAVGAIGDKVPHYGKYSYLVLEGTRVIAKGVWADTASPLVVELAGGTELKRRM